MAHRRQELLEVSTPSQNCDISEKDRILKIFSQGKQTGSVTALNSDIGEDEPGNDEKFSDGEDDEFEFQGEESDGGPPSSDGQNGTVRVEDEASDDNTGDGNGIEVACDEEDDLLKGCGKKHRVWSLL